jgi:hypothetical protein
MKTKTKLLLPVLGMALPLSLLAAQPSCDCAGPGPGGPAGFARNAADVVREPEMIPFLGVETETASSTITEQLGLPENTGLVVEQIVPDTAAAAELKRHDILLKLDDQVLIEPRQLAVLVRSHKVGDTIAVTYLRAGKQQTATLKLGKHEAPKMADWGDQGPDAMPFNFNPHGLSRDDMDRLLALMNNPAIEPPGPPGTPPPPEAGTMPNLNEVRVDVDNSNIVYTDDTGTLALTIKDGKKTLEARDAQGHRLFSGPIDTAEQRKTLPPEVLSRLQKLHGMKEFSFKVGRDFQGADSHVARPEGQNMALPPALPPSNQPPF